MLLVKLLKIDKFSFLSLKVVFPQSPHSFKFNTAFILYLGISLVLRYLGEAGGVNFHLFWLCSSLSQKDGFLISVIVCGTYHFVPVCG